ncbi:DegT/DnrJ/EryC1/StrS family aminotransferase [Devosia chinhatensis]|uniref:Pyridoxal phosphate-dependent aminotransferase n=1 Tax=Devosia chinhatensis TaxID=429727 RepID=A0A0F5FJB6_9HYPH|nr:aminotransferase class I/II-fold pyridoxal phosphate-dependent enzyme [Devosia chinhatensis]KKB08893.1 pyridoxal phosphate-dependent aminotransferase [Devosia chinhatensis]
MKVPFIDIARHEEGFRSAWSDKVARMTAETQFMGGAEVKALEDQLSTYCGTSFAVSCANGTDAIQLALRALGVGRDDVVLVPNATFWATFEAVVNVNAIPVTVDISLTDGGIDLAAFEEAIEAEKPKAAIVAHLYGWGTNALTALRALCLERGVQLIEDGAQAFGVTHDNAPIYAGALISTVSFYPAKVLGAAGDAGAVLTNDAELATRVRRLSNHGRTEHYGFGDVGWNSRMDSLQAAYLNLSFDHIDARIASRRAAADEYRRLLPALGIVPMAAPPSYGENGYCNVCLIEDAAQKTRIEDVLRTKEIGFGNIYPGTIASQAGAKPYLKAHYGGDNGDRLSRSVLNLPLFAYITQREIASVVEALSEALDARGAA